MKEDSMSLEDDKLEELYKTKTIANYTAVLAVVLFSLFVGIILF
jgi:hypothetical protein